MIHIIFWAFMLVIVPAAIVGTIWANRAYNAEIDARDALIADLEAALASGHRL